MSDDMIRGHFIDGAWRRDGDAAENRNPSDTDEVVEIYLRADRTIADEAIAAAHRARPAARDLTPEQRGDALEMIAAELLARREELGRLLAREEGKLLADAIGEVTRAGRVFRFFAGEALRLAGERFRSVRPGVQVEVSREPEGVIGIITPWNFPIAIPAWKIAPALAFGNTIVFKPADLTPSSGLALADMVGRSGLPAGMFNCVVGSGGTVGEAILESPKVAAVSFTGSTDVGRRVAAACVARGAKVQLEMGGKNPLIVTDDADLDVAVAVALDGAFGQTGQRCTASSRLIVEAGIHDRFVAALGEAMQALTVGSALDPASRMGPAASAAQLAQNQDYLCSARDEGGMCRGGELIDRDRPGHYMAAALVTETDATMRINREEVFGPVASVIRVRDFDEAVAVANDTAFGLSSGICTTSLAKAERFKRDSEAGLVMVNLPTAGVDYHAPFGGRKASSYGPREQGGYARDFYTAVKTAYVQP